MVKQIEAEFRKGTVSADQVSSAKEQQTAALQALQAEVLKIGG